MVVRFACSCNNFRSKYSLVHGIATLLTVFDSRLDQKTGALVDKLSETAIKNAAEAAAHAVTEAIARMSGHADDDDDEDEDEEDGGVGHNEAVGKGRK